MGNRSAIPHATKIPSKPQRGKDPKAEREGRKEKAERRRPRGKDREEKDKRRRGCVEAIFVEWVNARAFTHARICPRVYPCP